VVHTCTERNRGRFRVAATSSSNGGGGGGGRRCPLCGLLSGTGAGSGRYCCRKRACGSNGHHCKGTAAGHQHCDCLAAAGFAASAGAGKLNLCVHDRYKGSATPVNAAAAAAAARIRGGTTFRHFVHLSATRKDSSRGREKRGAVLPVRLCVGLATLCADGPLPRLLQLHDLATDQLLPNGQTFGVPLVLLLLLLLPARHRDRS